MSDECSPVNILTSKSLPKVKKQARDAFTLILEFTVFGSVRVSVFLQVKPSFQLLAHFRANKNLKPAVLEADYGMWDRHSETLQYSDCDAFNRARLSFPKRKNVLSSTLKISSIYFLIFDSFYRLSDKRNSYRSALREN